MSIIAGQSLTADFMVFSSTGALVNADSTPTGTLVISGTDNAASVTVTNKATGIYKAAVTVPATVQIGDVVQLRIAATVSSVASGGYLITDTVGISNVLLDSVRHSSGYYSATSTQYAFTAGGSVPSANAITGGLKGRLFSIISGTGAGQDRVISGSSVSGGVLILTFDVAFEVTPDNTSVWVIRRSRFPVLDSSLRVKAVDSYGSAFGSGSGARAVTITVNDGSTALQNAIVRMTEGSNSYTATTNASGVCTFGLDDATYIVSISKSGYSFSGTTLVVDGTETQTYSMTAISYTFTSDPDLSTIYFTALNSSNVGAAGIEFEFQMTTGPGIAGLSHSREIRTVTSIANGFVTIDFPRESTVVARRLSSTGKHGPWITIDVADASSTQAPEILGAPLQ